jgi:hypothetical protein
LTSADVLNIRASKDLVSNAYDGTIVDAFEHRVEQRYLVDLVFEIVDIDSIANVEGVFHKDEQTAGVEFTYGICNGKRTASEESPDCGCFG